MDMREKVTPPTGHLFYQVFESGRLIETFDEPNLIVDGSKVLHAHLIGGDVASHSITQIAFGTSGSAPAAGNSVITGSFAKALGAVSYPSASSVRFDFSLLSGEANGLSIFEFGLLAANNTLYARRVRGAALLKTSSISLSGSWVITF